MKRKHEESITSTLQNGKTKKLQLITISKVSKQQKNGIELDKPRRSSRKATIERRVWAEPRRDKNLKVNCNSACKRGRPRKSLTSTAIDTKKSRPTSSSGAVVRKTVIRERKNTRKVRRRLKNRSSAALSICGHGKDSFEKVIPDSTYIETDHIDCATVSLPFQNENSDGTLIDEDDISLLQSAIVDEVVKDYPAQPDDVCELKPFGAECYTKNSKSLLMGCAQIPNGIINTVQNKDTVSQGTSEPCNTEVNTYSSSEDKKVPDTYFVDESTVYSAFLCNEETGSKTDDKSRIPDCSERSASKAVCSTSTRHAGALQGENIARIDDAGGCFKSKCNDDLEETVNKIHSDNDLDLSDDEHVSLSEALAKLVDSDESGHSFREETVTIHPVVSADPTPSGLDEKCRDDISTEISSTFASKDNAHDASRSPKAIADVEHDDMEFQESVENFAKSEEDDKNSCYSNPEISTSTDEQSGEEPSSTCVSFHIKQPPPPLIRVPSKPPVIKTPLQCSECPMRFCTVRSLLWHFGTHVTNQQDRNCGTILLENLLTSWTDPQVPIKISSVRDIRESMVTDEQDDYFFSALKEVDNASQNIKNDCGTVNGDFILKVPVPRLNHKKFFVPKTTADLDSNGSSRDAFPFGARCSPASGVNIFPVPSRVASPGQASVNAKLLPAAIPSSAFSVSSSYPALNTATASNNKFPLYSSRGKDCALKHAPGASCASDSCSLSSSLSAVLPTSCPASLSTSTLSLVSSAMLSSSSPKSSVVTPISSYPTSHVSSQDECKNFFHSKLAKKEELRHPVTVIPVESLGKIRQQIQKSNFTIASPIKDEFKDKSNLLERDGLVMINQNLALRIVSENSDTNEIMCKQPRDDSLTCPKSSDSLTIFPQSKSFELGSNTNTCEGPVPDILTIVPQTNPAKRSEQKCAASSPHLLTAAGRVTPDSSQIVKLVLLPSKYSEKRSLQMRHKDKTEFSLEPNKRSVCQTRIRMGCSAMDENNCDSGDDEESEDDGMVIDVKEEGEESTMDPLSLCAVTMDDETSNRSSPASETNVAAASHLSEPSSSMKTNDVAKRYHIKVDDEKYQRRKYVCQYCQKRFGWSTDLKRHVILHTGERPFKCKWCPITFTRKFLLQNHMKKIHAQVCKWSDLWE